MKWLLISNTENRNPGDEWIRIGVQRLVMDVDPIPQFIIRNKEFPEDQDNEVEFDKAIWCGSPLFWSHQFQGCWENYWWDKWVNGWLFREKNKVLVLGVGNATGKTIHDEKGYLAAIDLVKSKCWMLVTRHKIVDDAEIPVSCCPSIFALAGDRTPKTIKLCNLMPDGAHDSFFDESEARTWSKKCGKISDMLIELGFEFVSHSLFEDDFAKSLNWKEERVHRKPGTSEEYLPIYAKAHRFVGNRLHGAVLTIGAGGSALAIGYDSRLAMVSHVGGSTVTPSQLNEKSLLKWIRTPQIVYDWRPEYERQLALVRRFSEA